MTQARGSDAVVLLFDEDTYGTAPGTPAGTKLYFERFRIQKSRRLIPSNVLGQGRDRSRPARGNINVQGPIDVEIGAEDYGRPMKHLLGGVNTSGADPYSHVLTPADLPVGLHIERDHGSNIGGSARFERIGGCRVASHTIRVPNEGAVTGAFNFVGSDVATNAATLDGSPEDNGHSSFSSSQCSIEQGGSGLAVATDVALTIDNGLDQSVYTIGGGGVRRALPEGFLSISGTLTALFEDDALLALALAGTETSLKVTLSRGDGLGSAGNESIEYLINQLEFEPQSPEISGPAGVSIQLGFSGYKKGATDSIQVTIKNEVATI